MTSNFTTIIPEVTDKMKLGSLSKFFLTVFVRLNSEAWWLLCTHKFSTCMRINPFHRKMSSDMREKGLQNCTSQQACLNYNWEVNKNKTIKFWFGTLFQAFPPHLFSIYLSDKCSFVVLFCWLFPFLSWLEEFYTCPWPSLYDKNDYWIKCMLV